MGRNLNGEACCGGQSVLNFEFIAFIFVAAVVIVDRFFVFFAAAAVVRGAVLTALIKDEAGLPGGQWLLSKKL